MVAQPCRTDGSISPRLFKINDEQLKIRAISDEKITVKLTNNYAFQKIFKNTKIVKGFLMALLDLKEYEIKKIEITDPFTLGENDEEKEGILDIKLILNQNRKINIEMQNTYQDDWTERSLFYNCRMFTDGLKKDILMEKFHHVFMLVF